MQTYKSDRFNSDQPTTPERDLTNLYESLMLVIFQAQKAVQILSPSAGLPYSTAGEKPTGESLERFTAHVLNTADAASDLEILHARVRSR